MAPFATLVVGFGLGLACSEVALAYTRTLTSGGKPIRWTNSAKTGISLSAHSGFKFVLKGNTQNSTGLDPADIGREVRLGLSRWQQAAAHAFDFLYSQGNRSNDGFKTESTFDGKSYLYFSSATRASTMAANHSNLGAGVLALTQTWYNPETGEILEADVEFNDLDYRFTLNPKDHGAVSASASGVINGPESTRPRIFFSNVLTHELGHAMGMAHSPHYESTMFFAEAQDQRHLSCDDQLGIRSLYPTQASARGELRGTLKTEDGHPLFAAVVKVVNLTAGRIEGSALTDEQGNYTVEGLNEGSYALLAQDLGLQQRKALPQFYTSRLSGSTRLHCLSGQGRLPLQFLHRRVLVGKGGDPSELGLSVVRCDSFSEGDGGASGEVGTEALTPGLPVLWTLGRVGEAAPEGSRSFAFKPSRGGDRLFVISNGLGLPVTLSASIQAAVAPVAGPHSPESGSDRGTNPRFISPSYLDTDSGMQISDLRIETDSPTEEGDVAVRVSASIHPSGRLDGAGGNRLSFPDVFVDPTETAKVLVILAPKVDAEPAPSAKCLQPDPTLPPGDSGSASQGGADQASSEGGPGPMSCGRVFRQSGRGSGMGSRNGLNGGSGDSGAASFYLALQWILVLGAMLVGQQQLKRSAEDAC